MALESAAPDIAAARLSDEQLAENFSDLHPLLDGHQALVESDRCYFCHDAPCTIACPTGIDIPLFIRQIATSTPKAAAETILAENILGGMCARVCPTETLCEEACVRMEAEGDPVKIGQLQRYATDTLMADGGTQPFERGEPTGKKVAVVGGGPAGLSCAHRLSMHGHDVTVFEARDKIGGLNEYGIAAYKTVDDFAQAEADFILDIGGIEVKTGQVFGRDFKLSELRKQYDAVFLGIGLAGVNALRAEGEDLKGVEDAVAFISDLRQADAKSALKIGRRVAVIGGGMTAIDAAVQSKKLGAEEVTILYRRGKENMNASVYEQELAQTSGVMIKHWSAPAGLIGEDGHVRTLQVARTALGADGKLAVTDEVQELPVDQVFKAIGQTFIADPISDVAEELKLENNRLWVDGNRKTSLSNVWAGGDCVAGGEDLTVTAVQDGKVAAEAITRALS